MAAVSNGREEAMEPVNESNNFVSDRLKSLYPNVNEIETPLPRSWSAKDKFNYIGLSQNNLRVHYKGHGKTHKDAASVRATHPIPPACGLYYFEVRIVSKGRDGYMGIGLSASGVNMNRLPGWDKHSYGYHGDDGNSFCSSGTGQPYGPTFTTGDVIGCGVNLVDNTCFYTKNGHHLGIAFRDLPPNLYPTVGLQTPGEVVDANFGQVPFMFDIEDMLRELRARTRLTINEFPTTQGQGEWQDILHKMVSTYLVHHGYCSTAEAFARSTGQEFDEEVTSIKNRQRILKLVLAGRMGEAIESTTRQYPGLLERNPDLLFMLKCRQFIEMVNGSDSEITPSRLKGASFPSVPASLVRPMSPRSPRSPSPVQTSVIQSTKTYCNKSRNGISVEELNQNNVLNGSPNKIFPPPLSNQDDSDVEMDSTSNGHSTISNGSSPSTTNGYLNGTNSIGQNGISKPPGIHSLSPRIIEPEFEDEDMEVDTSSRQVCGGHRGGVERMLEFGRELFQLAQKLQRDNPGASAHNQKMLEVPHTVKESVMDAFSLLAYSNPWASPLGWQLSPSRREPVCAALNSAILGSMDLPWSPPLEVATTHACELLSLMAGAGLGACAFASVEDLLRDGPAPTDTTAPPTATPTITSVTPTDSH